MYCHIPFCRSRCPYCAFVSTTGREDVMAVYDDTLIQELHHRLASFPGQTIRTVYVGGGTPSLLHPALLNRLLEAIPGKAIECTVEANPDSLTPEWLDAALRAGATRISIGVQSLDDRLLAALGRPHTSEQALQALAMARAAGFRDCSIDLMLGIPGQTPDILGNTLDRILSETPDHASFYLLSIEEDTEYFRLASARGLALPDDDLSADLYAMTLVRFAEAGYERYELSNVARPGHTCLHNRSYWDGSSYLGIGAGAHSFDGTRRSWNETDLDRYLADVKSRGEAETDSEVLDDATRREERIMLGLRTSDGLDMRLFGELDDTTARKCRERIVEFVDAGLIVMGSDNRLRLTDRGAVLSSDIITDLLAELP